MSDEQLDQHWALDDNAAYADPLTSERQEAAVPIFTASQFEIALTALLRNLEIAIVVDRHGQGYTWQVLEGGGRATTFLKAVEQALLHLERLYLLTEAKIQ